MTRLIDELAIILSRLAVRRPIFHSEADLQHELAWTIHEHFPNIEIRLEFPLSGRGAIDIRCRSETGVSAIELKYLCARCEADFNGEHFHLKHQAAHDIRSYDIIKDVVRVEEVIRSGAADDGAVVVLTNDATYWRGARAGTFASAFSMAHETEIEGRFAWPVNVGIGTMKKREAELVVANRYQLSWQDYSTVARLNGQISHFKYLALKVPRLSLHAN